MTFCMMSHAGEEASSTRKKKKVAPNREYTMGIPMKYSRKSMTTGIRSMGDRVIIPRHLPAQGCDRSDWSCP